MRLFIALLFDEATVEALADIRDSLHDGAVSGSFVPRDNLHLTLEFLGECSQGERKLAEKTMSALSFGEIDITMDRIGFFQRPDGDIWWVGVDECKSLMNLQRDLSSALRECGFTLEKRKYRPHITLGRRVITQTRPGAIGPIKTTVREMTLMLSERGNGRMVYTPIFSVKSE